MSKEKELKTKEKSYEELTLANDFIFMKVMQNEHLCRKFLEMVLGIRIKKINIHNTQRTIETSPDSKGIRLDVYVEGSDTVYNIEMQATDQGDLPKRTRYYQSKIDNSILEKGSDITYDDLKEMYIIFVCMFDPFEKGRHMYAFSSRCNEDVDVTLDDGVTKVFLNPYYTDLMDGEEEEIKNFLDYLKDESVIRNDYIRELNAEVNTARKNKEWRREYMDIAMNERLLFKRGHKEGLEEGQTLLVSAIQKIKNGETREMLLEQGFDQRTVDLAFSCRE